jgi:diguanylate cyclase (GGDEF)-like protein
MKIAPVLNDKSKLIAALWLLLSAGFMATTLVSYFISRDSIREAIVATELPLTSDNIYSEIQKDLVRPILISSMMSRDTFLREWVVAGERDIGQMTRYLKEVMSHYGAVTTFFVSEKTRSYYQAGGALKTVRPEEARDAWYFRVRNMSEPYEINVDPDLANRDKLTIFINYRVFDYNQHFIGATGVGLTVDSVGHMIDSYQQRYGRSVYLVDARGNIVMAGKNGAGGNDTARTSIHEIEGLRDQASAILKAGKGAFEYLSGGQHHFLNVRYIPELKWYLFVVKEENRAISAIQRTLYINLLLCALITFVVLLIVHTAINRYQRRLEQMATTDNLTGLANRHVLELLLDQGTREASRQKTPMSAILIDVDHFKQINDGRGHLAGDLVLKGLATTLRENLRSADIACRWGGEEFLVILTNTDLPASASVANTLRARIEQQKHPINGGHISITISAGVTAYREGESQESFISRADALLYQAKHEGRNRVCSEQRDEDVIRVEAPAPADHEATSAIKARYDETS